MKRLAILPLLLIASFGLSQEMMMPLPTAELKAIEWLNGDFKGDLTFSFGGEATKGSGTVKAAMTLNGRYSRAMHTYTMAPNTPEMEGMHMLTYNPDKKKYVATWFDGAGPGSIEMVGDLKDNVLQLTGPAEMMGQKMNMRATYSKKDGGFGFLLEMEQGGSWMKLIEGTFKKG